MTCYFHHSGPCHPVEHSNACLAVITGWPSEIIRSLR
uniref:Uncharacterized protein n=1 Tax=Arundo donax TaxID=35708 RepID=A0A0A9BGK4_ARUDO